MSERSSSYEQGHDTTPTVTAFTFVWDPRIRLAGEFALCLFWTAFFLVGMQLMAAIALYLVTGLFSMEYVFAQGRFSHAEVESAMSAVNTAPGGEDAMFFRLALAMLVCVGPVLLRAIQFGSRHLLDGSLFNRNGVASLALRWAGVISGAVVAGIIVGSF